jgi:hypothetical protein
MELERRHVIKVLHVNDLKFYENVTEFSKTYGLDAYAPPSIKCWLHQIKLGRIGFQTQDIGERPPLDDIDVEIRPVLRKFQFASVRMIADSLNIPVSTIYPRLVETIDLQIFASFDSPRINQ